MSLREPAMRFELSPAAVGHSVERGEDIARENGYRLIEYFVTFLSACPFHRRKPIGDEVCFIITLAADEDLLIEEKGFEQIYSSFRYVTS